MYNTCKYTMSRRSYSKHYQSVHKSSNDLPPEGSYNLWLSGFGDLVSTPENETLTASSLVGSSSSTNIGAAELRQKTYVVLPCGTVIRSTSSSPPPNHRFGKVYENFDERSSQSLKQLNHGENLNASSMKLLAYKPLETVTLMANEREKRSNVYFSKSSFDIAVGKAKKQNWLETIDILPPNERFSRATDFFRHMSDDAHKKQLVCLGRPNKLYHQFNSVKNEEELALIANVDVEYEEEEVSEEMSKINGPKWRNKWMKRVGSRAKRFYHNVKSSLDQREKKGTRLCCV